ncbi:MAG: AMP-binding protein [Hydrogenovibrio sp.]|uniref:AMP-binding protein n=1 Tax=Hydrogenovibrio sp. TaxID=2065821 RepID=UPI00286FB62F|nr:AMP-binding protein [Hydrogenovibrio sp.]MDR9498243.1 AMP-binding protein [Hydrogenovibrio sp.]
MTESKEKTETRREGAQASEPKKAPLPHYRPGLRHRVMRLVFKGLLKVLYRVRVKGLVHYQTALETDAPLLLVANHVSLIDGVLISVFVPGHTAFMIDEGHTRKWHERFLLSFVEHFKVNFYNPYAIKRVIKALKTGRQCMIFPEGRVTTTGSLMKIYEGTGLVAHKAGAQIVPIQIEGAQFSRFSYLDGTRVAFTPLRWFPRITLTLTPPRFLDLPNGATPSSHGHKRHKAYQNALFLLMRDVSFEANHQPKNLWQALLDAEKADVIKDICVEDINEVALTRKKLRLGAMILGKKLAQRLAQTSDTATETSAKTPKRVGVLLPNVSGLAVTFFGLQAYGLVPALLNFTAGLGPMRSACQTAQLQTIITSRKFVDAFDLGETLAALSDLVEVVYLEDVRETVTAVDKLSALVQRPKNLPGLVKNPNEEAVVLFTSGSEGVPKGVVLSHDNLVANIHQISAMLNLLPNEQLFNALPCFHSFGLTAGLLWPVLKGARVYLYPSPLHYAVIPEKLYHLNAKLLFGTDTFFNGYAKKADPYDFYSVRYMVAGAEKLRPETRRLFADKFHTPVLEGYGVTETAPVLAVNIPQSFKNGTVGQLVPGVSARLRSIDGITEGGSLQVKGPNVMLGYLLYDRPGQLQPPEDGWYDTGDVVTIDEEGFITIRGRAKRFAKIAGEMISLTAVETYINAANPQCHHVVVAVADPRKGEQLILVTNDESLSRQSVREAAKEAQVSDLMVPRTVILVEAIPVLGTGKTDYPAVQKIAEGHFQSTNS